MRSKTTKYNIEFTNIDTISKTDSNLITLKDIEKIEKEILKFKAENERNKLKIQTEQILNISNPQPNIGLLSTNGAYTWSWYAPFSGWGFTGITNNNHISHNHAYDWLNGKPYFISCSNIVSWNTGLQLAAGWVQTNSYFNIETRVNYNDTITNTVSGYWFLGFDVNGFPLGARINDTWPTQSLRII